VRCRQKILFIIPFLFLGIKGIGQENVKFWKDSLDKVHILIGDSLPMINLDEVYVFPPRVFKNKRQRLRYSRLVRNVRKALPYASIAGEELRKIDQELKKYPDKKDRKKYIKEAEKQLFSQFEGELRNLTFTQGRILIKLIDRETGDTTFDVVRELKGKFSAFFWQGVARLFGSNLKSEYNSAGEDRKIEEIILLIQAGLL